MKLIIPTLIAAAAFTSLHANERDDYYNSLLAKMHTSNSTTTTRVHANRDEYYNSLLAKAGVTPTANTVQKTTSRDEYYASLFAKTQNNNGTKRAVKRKIAAN